MGWPGLPTGLSCGHFGRIFEALVAKFGHLAENFDQELLIFYQISSIFVDFWPKIGVFFVHSITKTPNEQWRIHLTALSASAAPKSVMWPLIPAEKGGKCGHSSPKIGGKCGHSVKTAAPNVATLDPPLRLSRSPQKRRTGSGICTLSSVSPDDF